MSSEIVLFTDGDLSIEVQVNPEQETVWLTQKQMEELFDVKQATISEHINNILSSGELDETSIGFSDKSSGGRKPKVYNLDMILSVGYSVNSKRGIAFRRWANTVLHQYIMQGYALNEKRLQALERTVDIQTRMLADALSIEEADVLKAVDHYTNALTLLDQYDHQSITRPQGSEPIYQLKYEDCVKLVDAMRCAFDSDVFGFEREPGKVAGIIAAIYQSAFGEEIHKTIEEKAAHLLYFMVKDHPYADGCKRIAASLFLEFLYKNNALYVNGIKRISDGALVAVTLMIAESNPEEKDIMVSLVMIILSLAD
ncbi:MAG: virulence protein RhuM/Fic/DOC family protein [Clostridiales bacterium]|nr:virulence protein RhuM/Fic/DOC family protein [Clostridiales bacterium]